MTENNNSDSFKVLVASDNSDIRNKISAASQQISSDVTSIKITQSISVDSAKIDINTAIVEESPYDAVIIASPLSGDKRAASNAIKEGDFQDIATIMVKPEGEKIYQEVEEKANGILDISSRGSIPLSSEVLENAIRQALENFSTKQEENKQKTLEEALEEATAIMDQLDLDVLTTGSTPTSDKVQKAIRKQRDNNDKKSTQKDNWTERAASNSKDSPGTSL